MEYVLQIGDEFKIKERRNVSNWARCKDPNKVFIIHSLTNQYGGQYINYIDNRTNRKCRCSYCRAELVKEYCYSSGEYENKPYKRLHKSEIVLVRTKNQRSREISLKILNID
jgi:hypothetical protein